MDNQALAETYVGLWLSIDKNFKNRTNEEHGDETVNMIFEQTCKRIISDLIGKQRSSVPSKPYEQQAERPSEKQIEWATKLGCHNPERFSRKELSEWIDKNKKY